MLRSVAGSFTNRVDRRPEPVVGEIAAAVRGGNEDDAADLGAVCEDRGLGEDVLVIGRHLHLLGRDGEHLIPDPPLAVGDEQAADAAAHAVADDDHLPAQRILFLRLIQFPPEDGGGIRIGIAAGVAEEPELIVVTDLPVLAQVVDQRKPGGGRGFQPCTSSTTVLFGS